MCAAAILVETFKRPARGSRGRGSFARVVALAAAALLAAPGLGAAQMRQATVAQEQLANERQQFKQLQVAQLRAYETDLGLVVTLSGPLFSPGKTTLQPAADPQLERLASYLKSHPKEKVLIEGNTDSTGSAAASQRLSTAQAQAVAQALAARGVPQDQYQAIGLGGAYPIASNNTVAGRQQNSRVDIVFSNASGQFSEAAISTRGAVRR